MLPLKQHVEERSIKLQKENNSCVSHAEWRKKNEEFRVYVPKEMREHKQCSDDDANDNKKSKSERLFPSKPFLKAHMKMMEIFRMKYNLPTGKLRERVHTSIHIEIEWRGITKIYFGRVKSEVMSKKKLPSEGILCRLTMTECDHFSHFYFRI